MTWLPFALAGAVAQLVDGSLGMGFGLTSSTLLLTLGASAAVASAAVHFAEIGTTLASGASHWHRENVDKKIPLETIAKNKDLKLDSLLEEMETIAASGTKLNLDYAIDEWLDEYDQEEILEYFKSCETSSLQIAQQELSENDYTWEQLKIMRIKFLSVVGN